MKKDLIITMEEECISCPKLSLRTNDLWCNDHIQKFHECEHLADCSVIREHWEKVRATHENQNN